VPATRRDGGAAVTEPPLPDRPTSQRRTAEISPTERAFDEGFAALRTGDASTAAAAFDRAAAGTGGIAEDASFWRGVALRRAGRPGEALQAFLAHLARYPSSPRAGEAAVAAGWLELDGGSIASAVAHFELAAKDPVARVRASAADGLRAAAAPR
jgi:TolA-binding protein